MGPSASPSGLVSFEGDIVTGKLLSVSPGALDHYSLSIFLEKAQECYPHLSRAALEALARQIAYEAAFDIASVLWMSVGGIWPSIGKDRVAQSPIVFKHEMDVQESFARALEKSFKRLYRDVEVTNRSEVRSQLDATVPAPAKRAKLTQSRAPEERQAFSSNNENLYRAALLRCVRLPLTSTTTITPKKHKSVKKSKGKAPLMAEEDVDAGSGGFIRVAQLLSQLAPEAIHINSAIHSVELESEMTKRNTEPARIRIVSSSTAHFILAGQLCSAAHQATYAVWFMWNNTPTMDQCLKKAKKFVSSFVFEKNHDFSREWTAGSVKPSDLEWKARMSASFSLWKSQDAIGLNKADISTMLEVSLNKAPNEDEAVAWLRKLDTKGGGVVEWKEFESWARLDASDEELSRFSEFRSLVEHLDGTVWAPKLLIIDIPSGHAYLYSQKAFPLLATHPTRSSLKKMLKGSFDWKKHLHTGPGPTDCTMRFGKSPQDDSFILKFNPSHFKLISRLTDSLRSLGGIGTSSADNLLSHAFSAVDVALPALISLGECL